jgi:carboxyl-terminal processing protease
VHNILAKTLRQSLKTWALCLPILLAACGGGGGDDRDSDFGCPSTAVSAGVADRQDWLRCFFDASYLWYQLSPRPSSAGFTTVGDYFNALRYGGGDAIPGGGGALWPADRYSGFQSTESFNRFFGDGQTLGYGVAVNGLEARAQQQNTLFVRYIEPNSPAAQTRALDGGLQRGDEIVAINTTPVATLIAANDFSSLTPNAQGDQLRLDVRRGGAATVPVVLSAALFALTPVQNGKVVFSPTRNRSIGYVFVKDMISQAATPLASTMASFKAQGIQELVLDLRYNGGGLVSMGGTVASYAAGSAKAGQIYTQLLYNDKQSGNNQIYRFSDPGNGAGLSKVYVLMGERTCSASEQVINGLRGVGVTVVAVGGLSCGKPVGFLPRDDGQGTTYSIVNFEGVNARSEGRYFTGLSADCAVAEDLSKGIGALDDPLLSVAAYHADNGVCPPLSSRETPASRAHAARERYDGADGGERSGMSAR